jgi:ATP-dependent Lon protease
MTTEGSTKGLAEALEALPLFPLPQVALFPGATLPLHVFEPRYRALVRDALASHRALAVVQITGREADEHGHPPIAHVAGVGTIVDHMEMPGGRFNILLRGLAVVRLDELPFVPPYRRARASVLPDIEHEVDPAEVTALLSTATAFARLVRQRERGFELKLPRDAAPGLAADLCAAQLLLDGGDRQRALEERDVRRRVQLVTERLVLQQVALEPTGKDLN